MAIEVDHDWWKTLFDEIYLITDARSVCDENITRLEVDVICKLFPMSVDHKILDLCGGHGRHSFELCKRGFNFCTLLDYSQTLIDIARKEVRENDYPIKVLRCDARNIELLSETYDRVLIMGNSLGYIQQPDADSEILSEAHRVLRPGGWLLVDVADGEAVKKSFNPNAWHEIDGEMVVCRQREIGGDTIYVREMVIHKQDGLIRDRTYAVRLFELQPLEALIQAAGFNSIRFHTDFSPHQSQGDYGFMNRRMFAVGRKGI